MPSETVVFAYGGGSRATATITGATVGQSYWFSTTAPVSAGDTQTATETTLVLTATGIGGLSAGDTFSLQLNGPPALATLTAMAVVRFGTAGPFTLAGTWSFDGVKTVILTFTGTMGVTYRLAIDDVAGSANGTPTLGTGSSQMLTTVGGATCTDNYFVATLYDTAGADQPKAVRLFTAGLSGTGFAASSVEELPPDPTPGPAPNPVTNPTAASVPGIFDVVINGKGYCFDRAVDVNSPSDVPRATYAYSPTFVSRANVGEGYGDNQQDFWMTFSQHDWVEGEQQRFYRTNDPDRSRRYWTGSNINVRDAGKANIRPNLDSLSFGGSVTAVCGFGATILAADATNLYRISSNESIATLGAHSLTTAPTTIAAGDRNAYISALGGNGVMKWNGTTISQFSTSPCASLAVVNNSLYGHRSDQSDLVRFDTSGALSTVFVWKDPDGTHNSEFAKVIPYGGKLLILRIGNRGRNELWEYDGTAPAKLAEFPSNFITAYTFDPVEVVNGVVYVSGFEVVTSTLRRAAIYYYANGSTGLLWRSDSIGTSAALPMASWDGGLVFADPNAGKLFRYDPVNGGASSYATFTGTALNMAAGYYMLVLASGGTQGWFYPGNSTASSATVVTSLFDGDSALDKYFKAVKVDFTAGTDGDGGSVDIAYQTNGVDASYTSLASSVTAGTEYSLNQSARSVSIKVTLNKGTSTYGPTLKRIYIRGAPVLQSFPLREYTIDLSGVNGIGHVELNNGQTHPLDGYAQAALLNTAITSTTPLTIIDKFGTYTGFVLPDQSTIREVRPEEYIAVLRVRGV